MKVPSSVLLVLGAMVLVVSTAAVVTKIGSDLPESTDDTSGLESTPVETVVGPSSDAWQLAERKLEAALAVATRELAEMRDADSQVREYERQGYGLTYDRVAVNGETLTGTEAMEANLYMLSTGGRSLAVSIAEDELESLKGALAEAQSLGVVGAIVETARETVHKGEMDIAGLKALIRD